VIIDYLERGKWFKVLGKFNPKSNNIYLDVELTEDRYSLRRVFAHELRHLVQKIFGMLGLPREYLERDASYTEIYFS